MYLYIWASLSSVQVVEGVSLVNRTVEKGTVLTTAGLMPETLVMPLEMEWQGSRVRQLR